MTTRTSPPVGAPCWVDLWTSDVEGSGRFYGRLFGWEQQEQNPGFGGYFQFHRDGVPVAGGMGDMGDMKATNSWKIYFATDDAETSAKKVEAGGGTVAVPPMAVADLGVQLVLADPTGGAFGMWQPVTFPGFTVLEEHGTPSWFELHTRDHATTVAFYEAVTGLSAVVVGESDEFRYSMLTGPQGEQYGGIMDASNWLPEGAPGEWSVYWQVDDVEATVAMATELGASLIHPTETTPYGILAALTDPWGAAFKLRQTS